MRETRAGSGTGAQFEYFRGRISEGHSRIRCGRQAKGEEFPGSVSDEFRDKFGQKCVVRFVHAECGRPAT